jgi:hypothetical protein
MINIYKTHFINDLKKTYEFESLFSWIRIVEIYQTNIYSSMMQNLNN